MRSVSNYRIKACRDELLTHTSTAGSVPAGVWAAFHTFCVLFWTSVSMQCVAPSSRTAGVTGAASGSELSFFGAGGRKHANGHIASQAAYLETLARAQTAAPRSSLAMILPPADGSPAHLWGPSAAPSLAAFLLPSGECFPLWLSPRVSVLSLLSPLHHQLRSPLHPLRPCTAPPTGTVDAGSASPPRPPIPPPAGSAAEDHVPGLPFITISCDV